MEKLRGSGIELIGDIPWGMHFCQFYQTKEDLLDILIPYFRAGLENNEFCMWITSEPLDEQEVLNAMKKALPNFDQYLKKGQIEILPYTEGYLKGGEFESKRTLDGWVDKLNQALAKGYEGLRLTGNTFWLEKKDWKKFTDYENEVDNVISKCRMVAVCTYSLDKCGANEVIDVISNHRFVLIRREGKWEVIESSERKRTEESIAQLASFPELNPNPVVEVDLTGHIYYLNPATKQLFPDLQTAGREHPWLKGLDSLAEIFERQRKKSHFRELKISDVSYEQSIYYVLESKRLRIYGSDITERKQAEEALKNALEGSKQRGAEISALLEGSRAVLEYHEFKDSAQSIFDSCKNLIGATAGYIALLSKDGTENEVLFLDSGGLPCTVDPSLPMPIRGLREEAYRTGKAVFHNDFSKSEYVKFMPKGHADLRNVLFAPLVIKEKVTGLIGLANKPDSFTENDARMASAFGELAAIALHNSRTLESLEASEERFRSVVQTANDTIISVDSRGNIVFWNKSAEIIFGYSADEAISKPLTFIMPERFREDHRKGMNRLVSTGKSKMVGKTFETFGLRKDGSKFPIDLSLATWETREGIFFTGIIRDITERKQMEEELRKSRDELEIRVQERTAELMSVVEALQDEMAKREQAEEALREHSQILEGFFTSTITPLVFLDKEFNFIRVNEAYAKACQREVSEFPGHNHFEFYPSDARAIFEQVVQTKEPYQAIARPFTFPDHPEWGVTYWDWTLTPLLDDMSEVEFLVFSLEDVTKRKRAEEALRQNEELLRIVLDTLPVGVWVADKKGKLIFGNPAGQKIWGGAKYVGIDQYYEYKGWRPENGKRIEAEEWAMARAIRKGETSIDEEIEIESLDGIRKTILASAVPIRDANQEIAGGIVINQEITERKEVERRNNATNALLNLFSKKSLRKEYFDAVVDLIQNWSGCRCVGIRVLDKQGLIPYESYVGFSKEFWESENSLSIKRDQCACIRVITGNPDPQDASMMTPGGSFHCGNTFKFVGQLSEEEKARFRGVCVEHGFLSVCIVPVRYREEVLGAIHLADEREGQVPLRAMEFIEPMAPLIGEALNRFNLEEEIRESENRLRSLSGQLLTVQENERKRIARDIHDSIGQSLSAIKFRVESILEQTGKGPAKKMVQPIQTLIPIIQQSIEESRRIQMDLRPSVLDDLGIVVTCSWFCREFQTTFPGIHIEKKIEIEEDEVPQSLKTVIYRIMQEAMNNIAKHSKASAVSVSLKKREGEIDLIIQDNGQGFDIKETFSADGSSRGMGLSSMRERAELSGGSFSMESVPGKGTTIRATWNL